MASIVYITDGQMLEYHRLNCDRTMNFWRPSSGRNIIDFEKGDLLFFMVKGTERGKHKEKGILGYGKYVNSCSLSVKNMWKKFTTANGYSNENDFTEAVGRVSKTKELPKKISGFYLEDCTYFQAPIYLSEIGIKVSNNVESYIYPDKYEPSATQKILVKAQEVGEDYWLALNGEEDSDNINYRKDEIKYVLAKTVARYGNLYSEKENKKAAKMAEHIMRQVKQSGSEIEQVKGSLTYTASIQKDRIELFVPFVSLLKNETNTIQLMIGHCFVLKQEIIKQLPDENIEVTVCFDKNISEEYRQLLMQAQISYLIL